MPDPKSEVKAGRRFSWWPDFIIFLGLLGVGLYVLMQFPAPAAIVRKIATVERPIPPFEGTCPGTCCFGMHSGGFTTRCRLCGATGQIDGHNFCMKCGDKLGICLHCGRKPAPKPASSD